MKTRIIKERARSIQTKIPFKNLPKIIIIEQMKFVGMWLNAIPVNSGVSSTYRPRTIMTGTTLYWTKHLKSEFGAYCEVHEEHKPTNTIDNECNRSAICLGSIENFQGSYTFLCLNTGNWITCKKFIMVPMPVSVVERVEKLATTNTQFNDGCFKSTAAGSFDRFTASCPH